VLSFFFFFQRFVNKVCVLDDNVIASCSGDGTVRCWNLRSGEMLDYVDLNNVFLDSSNTAEKKSVVVMDLDYDHANGLVFALVEG
jgi:WD40 repeat protein